MRSLLTAVVLAVLVAWSAVAPRGQSSSVQFVFTSDAHYGLTRSRFQGASNVDAHVVNAAMVRKINTLTGVRFPRDVGLRAGEPVGPVDFLVEGGDVANRSEVTGARAIQSATASWSQFRTDYIEGLTLTDRTGARTVVYVVPGNHDASNATGFYRSMRPVVDDTSMVEIYNLMVAPSIRKTTATYRYDRDRVLASRDIGGLHLVFVTVWPDSAARAWMDRDLSRVSLSTPAIVFAHDQPEAEAKHFTNPNGTHDINDVDRFENLLADTLEDGRSIRASTKIEQRALQRFLARHPNVSAYFHGNSNWNQFYDWTGPDRSIVLHTFRVDSPMKGAVSSWDETKLSFQVVTIDTASSRMTVRECLWNVDSRNPSSPVAWGASTTVALDPRTPN
jgi:hypothetical protein